MSRSGWLPEAAYDSGYRRSPCPGPPAAIYRDHCIALLRRYFSMSVEIGRLPALLGREIFRTSAQDYHVHSFEKLVVFIIDVDRCLDRLHPFDKELIARIVLEEYTEEEASKLLHCGLRTIERRLPEALDTLTEMFLRAGMIDITKRVRPHAIASTQQVAPGKRRMPQRSPQGVSIEAAAELPTADRLILTRKRAQMANPFLPGNPFVKPPFSKISPQPAVTKANIFVSEVAGLPPQICYADYVS